MNNMLPRTCGTEDKQHRPYPGKTKKTGPSCSSIRQTTMAIAMINSRPQLKGREKKGSALRQSRSRSTNKKPLHCTWRVSWPRENQQFQIYPQMPARSIQPVRWPSSVKFATWNKRNILARSCLNRQKIIRLHRIMLTRPPITTSHRQNTYPSVTMDAIWTN